MLCFDNLLRNNRMDRECCQQLTIDVTASPPTLRLRVMLDCPYSQR